MNALRVCAARFAFICQIENENFDKNMFVTILFNANLPQLKINVSIWVCVSVCVCGMRTCGER